MCDNPNCDCEDCDCENCDCAAVGVAVGASGCENGGATTTTTAAPVYYLEGLDCSDSTLQVFSSWIDTVYFGYC